MSSKLLLFYNELNQQPASMGAKIPDLQIIGNLPSLKEAMENSGLVFIQATGELRQEAIKALLAKRKSFALLGLDPADLPVSPRLRTAARKKHFQVCWLGSLRFRQAAAKLKELLSSGCLGEISQCTKTNSSLWANYQTNDLLDWLLAEQKSAATFLSSSDKEDFTIEITASNGNAKLQLRKNGSDTLITKFNENKEKTLTFANNCKITEVATLLFLHKANKPWQMMAKPWPEN